MLKFIIFLDTISTFQSFKFIFQSFVWRGRRSWMKIGIIILNSFSVLKSQSSARTLVILLFILGLSFLNFHNYSFYVIFFWNLFRTVIALIVFFFVCRWFHRLYLLDYWRIQCWFGINLIILHLIPFLLNTILQSLQFIIERLLQAIIFFLMIILLVKKFFQCFFSIL